MARGNPNIGPRWVKGQSGNPKGRPKVDEDVKKIFKAATVPAAKALVAIVEDEKAKPLDRIRAAEIILDRVYGKAVQPIDAELSGKGAPFEVKITVKDGNEKEGG